LIPALLAFLGNSALLLLIGLGPSLALAGEGQGWGAWDCLALAPALGMALVAWLAGLLAFCGLALGPWVWPGTLLLLLASGVLVFRGRSRTAVPLHKTGVLALAACLLAWVLLRLAPQIWGGPGWALGVRFGGDIINYAQQARAYAQLGWRAVHSQDLASFTLAHPEFCRARFLADRLGTPFILAWQAHWSGLDEAPWTLLQGLQGLALSLPLAWLWLRRSGSRAWMAAWACLLAGAGFWALLSLRLSAVGWSCGLPLLLGLGLLTAQWARPSAAAGWPWRAWLLAGLLLQGLLLIYPEFLLPLACAWLAVLTLGQGRRKALLAAGLAAWLVAWLADPMALAYHLRFLGREIWGTARLSPAYAQHAAHNFLDQGFAWLPAGGAWAFLSRAAWGFWPWGQAWQIAGDLIGTLALACMALGAWHNRRSWNEEAALLLAMGWGSWLLALLAAGLAAPGISGKLCTYGGPFVMLSLGLAGGWPWAGARAWLKLPLLLLMVGQSALLCVGSPQWGFRALRPPFPGQARLGLEAGVWEDELGPLRRVLDADTQGLLLLDVADANLSNWAMLTLRPRPLDSLGSLDLDDRPPGGPGRARVPRWLLMDRLRLAGCDRRGLPVPAGLSPHFVLFHLQPGGLAAINQAICGVQGSWLSASQVEPGIWEYRFVADGRTRLRASIKPKPGAPGAEAALVLDRRVLLLAQARLGHERSVEFTPPPGVGRLGVMVAAPGRAEAVALRLRPWPKAQ
jgi:hypothetical protein